MIETDLFFTFMFLNKISYKIRNMKIIIFLFSFLPFICHSQNLSLSIESGYGFELNPMPIPEGNITIIASTPNSVTRQFSLVKHSYGEGLNIGIVAHYKIRSNIEIGLGLSQLEGKKEDITLTDINGSERVDLFYAKMARAIGEIKLVFPLDKNYIYTRLGGVLGFNGKIIQDINSNNINNWSRRVFSGGTSLGVTFGLGYQININKRLSCSSELRFFSQSYAPLKSEVTIAIVNGENRVEELSEFFRYTFNVEEFERTYTGGGQSLSEPAVQLKRFHSFSSIGLNINLTYKL
jgi:hypothetical protein